MSRFFLRNKGLYFFALILILVVSFFSTISRRDSITNNAKKGPSSFFPAHFSVSSQIVLVFGGDVMLSRNIRKISKEKKDPTFHWKEIASVFKDADLAFVNLENPVSLQGKNVGSIYSFRADPDMLKGLVFAGIDLVNLANNHVMDYGGIALSDTFFYLKRQRISYVGAGENSNEAHEGKIFEIKGVKIGFLGYTNLLPPFVFKPDASPAVAGIDDSMKVDIARMKKKADYVVVTLHFGEEYRTHRSDWQREIAYGLIDAGADAVVGHHPHVVEEIEKYKDGVIAYSLGNLIFDQNFSEDTKKGLVLRMTLARGKIQKIESLPIVFDADFVPSFTESTSSVFDLVSQ